MAVPESIYETWIKVGLSLGVGRVPKRSFAVL